MKFSRSSFAEARALSRTTFAGGSVLVEMADACSCALLLLILEWLVVGGLARAEFAGIWEVQDAVKRLVPLTWLLSTPMVLLGVGASRLLQRSAQRAGRPAPSRWLLSLPAMLCAGATAYGLSSGRHFHSVALRSGFVVLVGLVASAVVHLSSVPVGRALLLRPRLSACVAATCIFGCQVANQTTFHKLYPAYHWLLSAVAFGLCAIVALALRDEPLRAQRVVAVPSASQRVLGVAILWTVALLAGPFAVRRLAVADNLRFIVLNRAPLLRYGVSFASALLPPHAEELPRAEAGPSPESATPSSIRFQGRDIVLISIDALRADHVGAYGYARPTTPHLDALAKEGMVFRHAYCATPHTSYSITSLMTGKHMRPLLMQGLGEDSDTFAGLLRKYGYRTAAFYPPAVFFIDGEQFGRLRDDHLDFEFARVEFGDPLQRADWVSRYVGEQPPSQRLFLWVHLFEPHEPYVQHDAYRFGEKAIDRYDSEIAFVDEGVGRIVERIRAERPDAVFIVTADHGEEFGEHGGSYHGTTVFEEQVRVPLFIVAKGLLPPGEVEAPVQTIDVLPTVLAALDIPRPARIRGRDLLPKVQSPSNSGSAYAETDEQTLLAKDSFRLVCQRREGACALYDLHTDPEEKHDRSAVEGTLFGQMKGELRQRSAAHGQLESAGLRAEGKAYPDSLRRAMAGDGDAASDVAALLDDVEVIFRRKAAECLFELRRKEAAPGLRLALSRDEDDMVRRFAALALTRMGEGAPRTIDMLEDPDLNWRRLAALALAETGDARGGELLVDWWTKDRPPYPRARELLAVFSKIRPKGLVVPLLHAMDDVRLRAAIADTLGALDDSAARGPLALRFAQERYASARLAMARALAKLGAGYDLALPLGRFLGMPDPLEGGMEVATRAGLLDKMGGPKEAELRQIREGAGKEPVRFHVIVPAAGRSVGRRVLVWAETVDGHAGEVRVQRSLTHGLPAGGAEQREPDSDQAPSLTVGAGGPSQAHVDVASSLGNGSDMNLTVSTTPNVRLHGIVVLPLVDEIPPPPPERWDAPPH